MIPINLVFEDPLSKAVLQALIKQSHHNFVIINFLPDLKRQHSGSGFGYIKKRIRDFNKAARITPFLVLTDLDKNECPPVLIREWLPGTQHPNLIFRVAVREVEAWLLADRESFAQFLGISSQKIPFNIDTGIDDPKFFLVNLARKSRKRDIRNAIVPKPGSTAKVGPDYNGRLISFVQDEWNLKRGLQHSDSLKRAVNAINNFQPIFNTKYYS